MPISACPICGKPVSDRHRPFCGKGCADRDLLQWLGEGYRLPADPLTSEDGPGETPRNPGLDSGDDDD